jgi:hypothetical protein
MGDAGSVVSVLTPTTLPTPYKGLIIFFFLSRSEITDFFNTLLKFQRGY